MSVVRGPLVAIFLFIVSLNGYADSIKISAEKQIVYNYREWVSESGGCEKIKSFDGPFANRGTLELLIICLAFKAANFDAVIQLVETPNYTRALHEAAQGHVAMPAETAWSEDIDASLFFATVPVIKRGEFIKGLMMTPIRAEKYHYKIRKASDLKGLTVVVPSLWVVDWENVGKMGLARVDAPHKEAIFNMVKAGRGDLTVLEFSNESDLGTSFADVRLVPVKGIKFLLVGERRLLVSKKTPQAELIYKKLSEGLNVLIKNGTIARMWRESGFHSSNVKNWPLLTK